MFNFQWYSLKSSLSWLQILVCYTMLILRKIITFAFLFTAAWAEANPGIIIVTNETLKTMIERIASEYATSHDTPKPMMRTRSRADAITAFCMKPAHTYVLATSGVLTKNEIETCNALEGQKPDTHSFGRNAFVLVVNKSSSYTALTKEALASALTSNKNTWNEIHPKHKKYPIRIFIPGTETNEHVLLQKALSVEKLIANGTSIKLISSDDALFEYSDVFEKLAKDPQAIAILPYSAWDAHRSTTRALLLDGVAPTTESLRDGTYPLTFGMFVYTHADPSKEVKDFMRELKNPSATGKRGYLNKYGWIRP